MIDQDADGFELTKRHFLESIRFPTIAVLVLWGIHLYQEIGGWDPGMYGIMSRRLWGLQGILTGPLVHGSWGHLISNTIPLFILMAMTTYFYRKVARRAFWMIYFLTGASVWLFARNVSHIGASGVVYGLVAFIFWNGIFRRSVRSIMLAAIVILLYSGMFAGVLPDQEGVSWESHLLGSIVGIFTSFWYKSTLEDEELEKAHAYAIASETEKQYFLPRDAFELTKMERQALAEAEAEAARQRAAAQQDLYVPWGWYTTSSHHHTAPASTDESVG
jgi:membrane associated rhomboid family serine protease